MLYNWSCKFTGVLCSYCQCRFWFEDSG